MIAMTVQSVELNPQDKRSCLICYEEFDQAFLAVEDVEVGSNPPIILAECNHFFCHDCIEDHIKFAIATKRVPIPCPEVGCLSKVPKKLIETILLRKNSHAEGEHSADETTKLLKTWNTLEAKSSNPCLVSCPLCNYSFHDSGAHDEIACPSCKSTFCRLHGASHAGQTCDEFLASERGKHFLESEKVLNSCTKPCSHCGARLYKQVGCDFVRCPHCHRGMCYACGSHLHLSPTLYYCTKCGGPPHTQMPGWMMCLSVTVLCLICVVYPPIGLLLVLSSGCCCCFAFCGRGLRLEDEPIDDNNGGNERSSAQWAPRRGFIATLMVIAAPFAVLGDAGTNHWRLHFFPAWMIPRYTRARDIPVHPGKTNDHSATDDSA